MDNCYKTFVGNSNPTGLFFSDDAVHLIESLEVLVMPLKGLHQEMKLLGQVSGGKTNTQSLKTYSMPQFSLFVQMVRLLRSLQVSPTRVAYCIVKVGLAR